RWEFARVPGQKPAEVLESVDDDSCRPGFFPRPALALQQVEAVEDDDEGVPSLFPCGEQRGLELGRGTGAELSRPPVPWEVAEAGDRVFLDPVQTPRLNQEGIHLDRAPRSDKGDIMTRIHLHPARGQGPEGIVVRPEVAGTKGPRSGDAASRQVLPAQGDEDLLLGDRKVLHIRTEMSPER